MSNEITFDLYLQLEVTVQTIIKLIGSFVGQVIHNCCFPLWCQYYSCFQMIRGGCDIPTTDYQILCHRIGHFYTPCNSMQTRLWLRGNETTTNESILTDYTFWSTPAKNYCPYIPMHCFHRGHSFDFPRTIFTWMTEYIVYT